MEKFADLEKISPNIILDIRYATTNNFTGKKWYELPKCFLRLSVAEKIAKIQRKLEKEGLTLKLFDGYRPHFVTQGFWDLMEDKRFVADPVIGSKHNRGAAIDLTIVDMRNCKEWEMPTEFDSFEEKARRDYFDLSEHILRNRAFLDHIMLQEKFEPLPHEWWHFNDCNWELYPLENVSFEEILSSDKWLDRSF